MEQEIKQNISLRYRFAGYFAGANDLPCYHVPIWLFKMPVVFYIVGSVLIGIGNAFRSGSIGAIIYEEHSIAKISERYHIFQSRSMSGFYLVRLAGMPLGAYIYTVNAKLPLVLTVISLFLCGLFALMLTDKNITPEHHNARSLLKKTFKELRASSEMKSLCILVFIAGIFGNAMWRLFQPAYQYLSFDSKYIGWYYTLFSLGGIVGSLTLGKINNRNKIFKYLFSHFVIGAIIFTIAAINLNIYTIVIAVLGVSIFFPLSEVALIAYIQHKFERYQQATIMSVISFLYWAGLNIGDLYAGISEGLFGIRGSITANAVMGVSMVLVSTPIIFKNLRDRYPERSEELVL